MIPVSRELLVPNIRQEQERLGQYMPIVHQTAATFQRRLPVNVQRDDLIAAGTWGLVDSLRRAQDSEGVAFECYVRIRIRGAMVDELRAQDWLPRRVRRAISRQQPEGDTATVVGFDDMTGRDAMALADKGTPTPMEQVAAASERKMVAAAMGKLPPRERTVVQLHYFSGVRFKQISTMLGVSEPRISQLHSRALQRLREMLACDMAA